MFPRLHAFLTPIDAQAGLYRLRVLKGWWGGPGTGGRTAVLADIEVSVKSTDERERMREALRAAADAL